MIAIKGMEMPGDCYSCDFESYPRGAHYCQLVMRAIESLGRPDWCPLVEVEPVRHGRWVHHTDWESDGECAYECSVCGMGSDVDYAFCMRCGAKMDGGSDG